jgi:hypothetical protein
MDNPIDKQATKKKLTWEAPRLIEEELSGTEGKSSDWAESGPEFGPS